MAKNKLQIKKNLKLGWKLTLVRLIPGVIVGGVLSWFKLSAENPGLRELLVLGGALLILLYSEGFLVNKFKKWVFK